MEISLLALKYFQKAAQLQHLTKAAAQLHIAQPSLSRTIRGLEETFGVPLFDRQGRKLVLNAYGKILLKHTNHILLSMDNLYQEIGNVCQENDSTVTLSVCAASEIIPGLLQDFQKDYPGTRVQILQYDSASADASKSDLTVFSSITPIDNSHCATLLEEEIMLEMPSRTLCREDCLGLCPKCGKNLNEGSCGCAQHEPDPRLAVLKTLLK